jgi:hypothetical protein
MKKLILGGIALTMGAVANAQFQINELFINPSGTDDGFEYVELKGTPGASLSGYSFVSMDGDSTSAGIADVVVDLSSFSFGSNGLALIRFGTLISALESATTVIDQPINPNLENGSNTFMLVQGLPTVGVDYDVEPDGVLDANWTFNIVDSVGWTDTAAAGDFVYGPGLRYIQGTVGTFTPDAFYRLPGDGALFGDVNAGTGVTNFNTSIVALYSQYRGAHLDGTSRDADWEDWANSGYANPGDPNRLLVPNQTPGGTNPVPEPASMLAMAGGIAALVAKRRNKK